ncbi:hypothetical protein, partial [Pseudomonas putida]|uniref:hypothetical protein n=1 Tax=Pseudomonas putida TaxID=303 RepID=UPI0005BDDB68
MQATTGKDFRFPPALTLAFDLAFDLLLIWLLILILIFATSGGRTQALRREVTGMDARQALGPRMGPAARS